MQARKSPAAGDEIYIDSSVFCKYAAELLEEAGGIRLTEDIEGGPGCSYLKVILYSEEPAKTVELALAQLQKTLST